MYRFYLLDTECFNHIFGLILRVENARMYLLLQVLKHYKYHLHLVVTLAHYSLMIFSNFGSGEHTEEREMCLGHGCLYVN